MTAITNTESKRFATMLVTAAGALFLLELIRYAIISSNPLTSRMAFALFCSATILLLTIIFFKLIHITRSWRNVTMVYVVLYVVLRILWGVFHG